MIRLEISDLVAKLDTQYTTTAAVKLLIYEPMVVVILPSFVNKRNEITPGFSSRNTLSEVSAARNHVATTLLKIDKKIRE